MSGPPKPAVAARLSWPQVHAFRMSRHHLDRRASKEDLARTIAGMTGVQAQVMSAAELQVAVRVDCTVKDVRKALWQDRTLAKTWLMRGTLHLVPSDDLALYTASMRRHWIRSPNAWLKFWGLTETQLIEVVDLIGAKLSAEPMTREKIIGAVGRGRSEGIQRALRSGWGGMLKPVARRGMLCFGPSRGQSVTFVRPELWLGSWQNLDPDHSLLELGRRYLRAFGPATKADFARWWGHWPGAGKTAWEGLAGELVDVDVEGWRCQALAADLDQLQSPPEVPLVQLLPPFDPYLLGHVNRDHLFDLKHRPKVSRTAGWISAVVLVQGRVAAVWNHEVVKDRLRLNVEPLHRLPPKALTEIKRRGGAIARSLGLEKVEVRVA